MARKTAEQCERYGINLIEAAEECKLPAVAAPSDESGSESESSAASPSPVAGAAATPAPKSPGLDGAARAAEEALRSAERAPDEGSASESSSESDSDSSSPLIGNIHSRDCEDSPQPVAKRRRRAPDVESPEYPGVAAGSPAIVFGSGTAPGTPPISPFYLGAYSGLTPPW